MGERGREGGGSSITDFSSERRRRRPDEPMVVVVVVVMEVSEDFCGVGEGAVDGCIEGSKVGW